MELTAIPIHASRTRTESIARVLDPIIPICASRTRTDSVARVVDSTTKAEHAHEARDVESMQLTLRTPAGKQCILPDHAWGWGGGPCPEGQGTPS